MIVSGSRRIATFVEEKIDGWASPMA